MIGYMFTCANREYYVKQYAYVCVWICKKGSYDSYVQLWIHNYLEIHFGNICSYLKKLQSYTCMHLFRH